MKPEGGVYRVVASEVVRGQLRICQQQAQARQLTDECREVLLTMVNRLTVHPLEWGDPLFRLHGLNLLVCHRLAGPLSISFAVDDENRVVYLRSIRFVA